VLLVLGAGGHAHPVIEALRAIGLMVAGLLDDSARAPVLGVPVLGPLDSLGTHGESAAAIAIGANALRARLGAACQARGLDLPNVIHPAALLSPSARIGVGVQVMARAVIGPEAKLGDLTLVNTGAIVEHGCTLGTAAHVGPGAVLSGGVEVGARVLVGAGAVVRPCCSIGADALIGAGAAVVKDVAAGARVGGVPVRPF
jgi:UDP-perosamine 4-acetyltransferase